MAKAIGLRVARSGEDSALLDVPGQFHSSLCLWFWGHVSEQLSPFSSVPSRDSAESQASL